MKFGFIHLIGFRVGSARVF